MSNDPRIHDPGTHAIVDAAYLGAHKYCRCVMRPIDLEQHLPQDAAPLICDPVVEVKPPAELTRVITVTVKLEPAELEEIAQRMRETIAEAYGLPMRMLFGGDDVR